MVGTQTLVKDLGDEYTLVQQDQEVREILDDLGLVFYQNIDDTWGSVEYQVLFVKMGEGEYTEIWGCESWPGLDCPVYRLDKGPGASAPNGRY